jgi:CRP/FNR family transcriptional regulator, dissimilatory nitrate respiration regulator
MLMRTDELALLSRHHLFDALTAEQIERVCRAARVEALPAGQVLFCRGDPAEHFFVVLAGQVKLALQARDGTEQVVEVVGSGQSFAEAVMFMDIASYPVSAQALEESAVVSIACREYRGMLLQNGAVALRMLGSLSRRLHEMTYKIEILTLQSATGRLARFLLRALQAGASDGMVRLREPKHLIAARLAIAPETLSRVLRKFADLGVIRVAGPEIFVCDAAQLQALHEESC